MAKLSKLSRSPLKNKAKGATGSGNTRQSSPSMIAGLALAAAVGVLLFAFTSRLDSKVEVYVAKASIAPYTTLDPDRDLEVKEVPKDSVEPTDITVEEFKQAYLDKKLVAVTRTELLPKQRLHEAALAPSEVGTLSVIKKDERLVAVNATFSGVTGGVVTAGSVVDVYSAGSGGGVISGEGDVSNRLATDVKVLGVGAGAGVAEDLRPSGSGVKGKKADDGGDGGLVVLLAVSADQAAQIIGAGQVHLALNPHKSFDAEGNVCEISKCVTRPARVSELQAEAAEEGEKQADEVSSQQSEGQGASPHQQAPPGGSGNIQGPDTPLDLNGAEDHGDLPSVRPEDEGALR